MTTAQGVRRDVIATTDTPSHPRLRHGLRTSTAPGSRQDISAIGEPSCQLGDSVGRWLLAEPLGQGSNGEVWSCTRPGYDGTAAIKVLSNQRNAERFGRFRNEIGFLLTQRQRPGVVPIVDHDLDSNGKVWYVMPLAVPLRDALEGDRATQGVVEAMAAISATLAALAEGGIAHRDLKPDNLFRLDRAWCIGDFGLVKYPNGTPLTRHGRKLGPADFMAPEMRECPDEADPAAADVYSFAKTLWVLVAGANIPFPGAHRADDEICRLTARVDYKYAPELDLIIERSTARDPTSRPSMREVAEELSAMLKPPADQPIFASGEDLEPRIAALTARHQRRADDRTTTYTRIARSWERMREEVVRPAFFALAERLDGFGTRHPTEVAMPRSLISTPSIEVGHSRWGGIRHLSRHSRGRSGQRLAVWWLGSQAA
ncbi:protein kinase [Actinoplanes sp. NPDC049265]|uniref:protein kinase domain-containing protein n=1 Tax=Actinoplanes sp. NPDC049265 TaxID=3363902 RepID=UPI00371F3FB9